TAFVLPGGTRAAIQLHHCRVQTRKCERLLVALSEIVEFDSNILKFVNRLSDFFFMAARYSNHKNKVEEASW
ncbi:MAG: ATP:cob(I)alamin adenosyltransferase, partial [Ignavibacteriae bacterium]|nr:ATP:cob(I)alamin adenosyltransferase [Ignavibacteriota bacterium]